MHVNQPIQGGKHQSIGSRPSASSAAFAREKGRLPKKPRWADRGEGWGDSIIACRLVSINAFFWRAEDPQRMKTTRSLFPFTDLMTWSVKVSQPFFWWLAALRARTVRVALRRSTP
jgi:hypothetical protein